MELITATTNPKYKVWSQLLHAKGIKKEGMALVSGSSVVKEALKNKLLDLQCLLLPPKTNLNDLQWEIPASLSLFQLGSELFNALDANNTKAPLLIIKIPELPQWDGMLPGGRSLICATSDPSNTGALIRSAVAFGVENIILTKECCHPFHHKVIKTSCGAVLVARLLQGPSLLEINIPTIYLQLSGKNIYDFNWPQQGLLVVGQEGQGIPVNIQGEALHIPMNTQVESLSAPISGAIAMSLWASKIL